MEHVRKVFLSIINRVYSWRLFCTTHEHYNYLQLTQFNEVKLKLKNIYRIKNLSAGLGRELTN